MKGFTFYEQIIIDSIDLKPFDLSNDSYLYDKVKTTFNIFKREYLHANNANRPIEEVFSEYLRGLPSVLSVPYMNYDILELAKKEGLIIKEYDEDKFLEEYWVKLAKAFFTLYDNL